MRLLVAHNVLFDVAYGLLVLLIFGLVHGTARRLRVHKGEFGAIHIEILHG